jgi:hypothetical protein
MNDITSKQNSEKQLRRLAAQRQLYSTAKGIFGVQLVLGGPIAVTCAITALAIPSVEGYVAVCGVVITLVDLFWLEPWQKRLRERAARIQEIFDCDVLQLSWNDIKVGSKPDTELVKEQADKYFKYVQNPLPLSNWYPTVVGSLPVDMARIVCQRSNCWWDSNQRKHYATLVVATLAVICLSILVVGLIGGLTLEKFFLVIVAPLLPAVVIGIRQYSDQMEAAERLDKLKEHAEELWAAAIQPHSAPDLATKSRFLQDEIFENRRKSPFVFDWIFRRLRNAYEDQMNYSAETLAAEAKRVMGVIN